MVIENKVESKVCQKVTKENLTALMSNYFHVLTQGINKSYIFRKSTDINYYINLMYSISKKLDIKIIAYCIMNNHAHILIETDKVNDLSKYMQRLNTIYAKYYNKKYSRVGYVFRDRYKSEGIYSEEHLYNCIKYIYDNPVKAGICKRPEEYLYSNYRRIDKQLKEKYVFMDIDEDKAECEKVIEEFLIENNIILDDLKRDKNKLKELIIILKTEYNISLRKISEKLRMGRETIRKIYLE